ncbi:Metallo-dependent phosphatase-like protein [Xylariales sp. PMI_506]|nr:Metallo-dependent phosphatase-like protein [Xylariales sp. PMI_506]
MSQFTEADTIRILVSTDNHVGYEERDSIRGDDSWQTFEEIMNLARQQDVDMVLLAGDLFHDNKPSRKSMFKVMRALRKNCLGMKPVELQFLSDASVVLEGPFGHVNYEDPDMNISIPVFSIHGNHDDPSGDGQLCSLDILQVAGLVNYFGRVPEADKIEAKPVLLQKGLTKLALYGISNVRDERMYRTFRDHRVKWFRPNVQSSDWFNLLAVHQNHHAHTPTSYLPEGMLPDWLDLVVWGHEHECLIDPTHNPETGFHVMQPGSSVATSLVPGEAVAKHVAIVSITGKDFQVEKHRLKTVRPFVTREIVLATDARFKGLERKKENRQELTRRLTAVIDEMIAEANAEWESIQENPDEIDEQIHPPLPLIRLKVEYTPPEGGHYDCENPQRFSNRFVGKVANTNDVVYFFRKKKGAIKREKIETSLPDEVMQKMEQEGFRVDKLVNEFLARQSLKILPQAPFGEAVDQYVSKDDKHAMEQFVSDCLAGQVKQMLSLDNENEDIENEMAKYKAKLEQQFKAGKFRQRKARYKPKPDGWDSDLDGHWLDQPGAIEYDDQPAPVPAQVSQPAKSQARAKKTTQVIEDNEEDEEMDDFVVDEEEQAAPPATKARGRGNAATKSATTKAPAKKTAAKPAPRARGRKAIFEEDSDEIMEEDPALAAPKRTTAATKSQPARSQPSRAATAASQANMKQSKLSFSQKASQAVEISDDEISDDEDDPFEPMAAKKTTRRR